MLLDSWKDKVPATKLRDFLSPPRQRAPRSRISTPGMSFYSPQGGLNDEVSITSPGCLARCVMHPQNPIVVVWTVLSLVLIAYDTVTVPLYTFYKFEQFPIVIFVVDWIARVFWTVDMLLSSATIVNSSIICSVPLSIVPRSLQRSPGTRQARLSSRAS